MKKKPIRIKIKYDLGRPFSVQVHEITKPKDKKNQIRVWQIIDNKSRRAVTKFYSLTNLVTGGVYYSVTMNIPMYFESIVKKPKKSQEKYRYKGNFLVKPKLIKNESLTSRDGGREGCPYGINIDVCENPADCEQNPLKASKKPKPVDYFVFNGNRFYPMILTNWQVFYYVSENGYPIEDRYVSAADASGNIKETKRKRFYKPELHLIGNEVPIHYDPTLGVFLSRQVSILDRHTKRHIK